MNSIELRAELKAVLTDKALTGDFCQSLLQSIVYTSLQYGQEKYEEGYTEGHQRATDYALMIEAQLKEDIADLKGEPYNEKFSIQ